MWNRASASILLSAAVHFAAAPCLAGASAPPSPSSQQYEPGANYEFGQVVSLPGGNTLAAQIRKAGSPTEIRVAVGGPLRTIAFTFGRPDSAVRLRIGEQVVPAASAVFDAAEVVAEPSAPMLVSRMRTAADNGMLVLDTNEHPLIVRFEVPEGLAPGPVSLELRDFTVGREKLALQFASPLPQAASALVPPPGLGARLAALQRAGDAAVVVKASDDAYWVFRADRISKVAGTTLTLSARTFTCRAKLIDPTAAPDEIGRAMEEHLSRPDQGPAFLAVRPDGRPWLGGTKGDLKVEASIEVAAILAPAPQ